MDRFAPVQIRVGALNSELLELRSRLEDTASLHERELHSFRETCADLRSQADIALKEVPGRIVPSRVMTVVAEEA